jgi:hypothetical protein
LAQILGQPCEFQVGEGALPCIVAADLNAAPAVGPSAPYAALAYRRATQQGDADGLDSHGRRFIQEPLRIFYVKNHS